MKKSIENDHKNDINPHRDLLISLALHRPWQLVCTYSEGSGRIMQQFVHR